MKILCSTLLACLLVASCCGCGYRLTGSDALYREDVRTVAVPVVLNRTFFRTDADQLTDALVRAIQTRTPYVPADPSEADTVLEVTITGVQRQTTSRSRATALPEEQLYIMVVDVVWKDLRTGEVLMRRENLEQTAAQYATLGESTYIASQNAAEALAAGIVEEMTGDW